MEMEIRESELYADGEHMKSKTFRNKKCILITIIVLLACIGLFSMSKSASTYPFQLSVITNLAVEHEYGIVSRSLFQSSEAVIELRKEESELGTEHGRSLFGIHKSLLGSTTTKLFKSIAKAKAEKELRKEESGKDTGEDPEKPETDDDSSSERDSPNISSKIGQQHVKAGCVNLYGSDYHRIKNTKCLVVCEDAMLSKDDLDAFGIGVDSSNHGISYLETGPNTWLTLYKNGQGRDFTGLSKTFSPLSLINLESDALGWHDNGLNWNDNAKSLTVTHSKGSHLYQIHHHIDLPSPNCVALYGSHPQKGPDTTGLFACGDGSHNKEYTFTRKTIAKYGYALKDYSKGVSFVRTGKNVGVTLFTGSDEETSDHSTYIGPSKSVDLTEISLGLGIDGKDVGRSWNDATVSFKLMFM